MTGAAERLISRGLSSFISDPTRLGEIADSDRETLAWEWILGRRIQNYTVLSTIGLGDPDSAVLGRQALSPTPNTVRHSPECTSCHPPPRNLTQNFIFFSLSHALHIICLFK